MDPSSMKVTISTEKPKSSKCSLVSGARHVIVSRRAAFQIVVIVVGLLAGAFQAERLRLHHNATKLKDGKSKMKGTNIRLKAEKDDYKKLFKQMADQLETWKAAKHEGSQTHHMTSFKDMSEELMAGLDDVRTVLEEKEFQLWEKEGLLEYQEERLLDSEDQEVQMALYINMLARMMLDANITLPVGLEEQPYYGARSTDLIDESPSLDDQVPADLVETRGGHND